jgi:hypothetical protein
MNFVILILGIWICATVGAWKTKDSDPYGAALVATFLIGFGYLASR